MLSIDGYRFNTTEGIEVYLDGKRPGHKVSLAFLQHSGEITSEIILVNYYSVLDLIIYLLSGILFLAIGLFTIMKARQRKIALLFYSGCSGAALLITLTPGCYNLLNSLTGYLLKFIFHSAYTVTPVIFVHFILNFPLQRKSSSSLIRTDYFFAILIAVVLTFFFIRGAESNSPDLINPYILAYNYLLRVFVIINFLSAVILFSYTYAHIKSTGDRKKLKWLLYGFILGPLSYTFFWVIPYLLYGRGLLPEYLVIGMLSAVPLTFAIAIVKYHFFDIDLIINRSVVYLIVVSSLVIFYLIISTVISIAVKGINETIPAVISVSAAMLLLNPARKQVQSFVDRKFFRVHYNYREALRKFLNEMDACHDIKTLAASIVNRIQELIPSEKIGFFELLPGDRIKLIAQSNFDLLMNRVIPFKRWELKTDLRKPVALTLLAEEGVDIEPADTEVFNRWGMALVFPFSSGDNEISGFLVLGKKKSGVRFTIEDIDLLNAVRSKVAAVMERNKYQQQLFLEHMEKERLEEINKLKSFIVSRVSHDFRNPLQTISMFTELLLDRKDYSPEKVYDYLKIIDAESKRLKSMAENVLDFTKIEKGGFQYHFEAVELNNFTMKVIESLKGQFELNKFKVEVNCTAEELLICADSVGLEAVLLNLISNSIKYSNERKSLFVLTGREGENPFISIKDEGIGISKEDLDNIFNPFLRGHNIDPKKIKGAGLGLSIVKHIIDSHNGRIIVDSTPGKGSCFKILFPPAGQGRIFDEVNPREGN